MEHFKFTELNISGGDTGSVRFEDIAYSPELMVWVAVGSLGTPSNTIMRSVDGRNWTFHTMPTSGWSSVVWAPGLAKFVALTSGRVATSVDGATWVTSATFAPSNEWPSNCIEWSEDLGLLVTGSSASAATPTSTKRFATSPDAVNWTHIDPTPNRAVEAICWSPTLSLFVAACSAFGGGVDAMWTSPDANTWTPRNLPDAFFINNASGHHNLLVWADDLGLFVCVREDGSVVTSPDGTNWSIMTPSTDPDAQVIESVCWAKRLGALIFGGLDDGFGSKPIHWSEDGVTIHTVDYAGPNSRNWAFPAYSGTLDVMPIVRKFGYSVLLVDFGPEIIAVVPPVGDVAGGETVEIQGGGFEPDTEVVFGGRIVRDVTYVSDVSLLCVVPSHPEGVGFVDVTVTNVNGRFDTGTDFYEYIETDGGIPTIESGGIQCGPGAIVPNEGQLIGGMLVTINGAGFVTGSTVFFGDQEATGVVVVSPTQITAVTPPHQLGPVDVTVITP